jgi:hypothetical protein
VLVDDAAGAASAGADWSADGGANWNRPGSVLMASVAFVNPFDAPLNGSVVGPLPTPLTSGALGSANAGPARPTPRAARPATATVVRTLRRTRLSMVDPSVLGSLRDPDASTKPRRQGMSGFTQTGSNLRRRWDPVHRVG